MDKSLGDMIFDLVYNIYDFDEDATIVFAGAEITCRHCNHRLRRRVIDAHYTVCICGKRHMFRRQKFAPLRRTI